MEYPDSNRRGFLCSSLATLGAVVALGLYPEKVRAEAEKNAENGSQLPILFSPDSLTSYDFAQDPELQVLPPEYRDFLMSEEISLDKLIILIEAIHDSENFEKCVRLEIQLKLNDEIVTALLLTGAGAIKLIFQSGFREANLPNGQQEVSDLEQAYLMFSTWLKSMMQKGATIDPFVANNLINTFVFRTKDGLSFWVNLNNGIEKEITQRSIYSSRDRGSLGAEELRFGRYTLKLGDPTHVEISFVSCNKSHPEMEEGSMLPHLERDINSQMFV